jgi:site-specific DNA-adenine methylase
MRYGMPYKGSKNAIAEKIISALPPAEHFYDLFGGGGAISHCAVLSGKYKHVHYNELDPLIFKGFKMAVNGEFKDENRWISREDFFKLKDTDPYVAICFSFGNDLKTYCYSKKLESFKKAFHYAVVFRDFSLLDDLGIHIDHSLRGRTNIAKAIKATDNDLHVQIKLQSLARLESLERLESFNSLGLSCTNQSYDEVDIEPNSVVYCDPPYADTNTYVLEFEHLKFYEWAKEQDNIFISEYAMPDDFVELVSINKRVLMDATRKGENKQEKIFTNKKTYERMITNNLLLW